MPCGWHQGHASWDVEPPVMGKRRSKEAAEAGS